MRAGHADIPFTRLVDAVRALYARDIAAGGAAAAMLAAVDHALAGLAHAESVPTPRELPVCRHLDAAVAAARGSAAEPVAAALCGLRPRLRWIQNPNYDDTLMGAGYMANYGYCNLLGWDGFAAREGLSCGFLLLGPGLHYPDHAHPAEEIYHPLNAAAEWSRDGGGFAVAPAGALLHHPPWMRHATRVVAGHALLALYCWRGELGADKARLV